MNDILDIEIILKKQKYSLVYNIGWIIMIIILLFIYVSFTYKYQNYYINQGIMVDGNIKLLVKIDEIKYITNNKVLNIDNQNYDYIVKEISEELYVDESFTNYKYVYIQAKNINNINNYVYTIKIKKEYKKIIEYLKDYF